VKKLLIALLVAGLLLAGVAWKVSRSNSNGGQEEYTFAAAEFGTMKETVGATGALQPKDVVAVGSQVSGQVVEISSAADANKMVREGDALLKLDDRAARQKLDQAESLLRMAKADVVRAEAMRDIAQIELGRQHELRKSNLVPEREVERAKNQVKAAEAGVEAAQAKASEADVARQMAQLGLDLTTVRVPGTNDRVAGPSQEKPEYTVMERKVVLGQLIAPPASAQLFTLASDLGNLQVHAQVSEDDIGKIGVGKAATFTVYAYPQDEVQFQGKVVEIRPMPANVHGLVFYDTIIDVANERDPKTREWKLRPGMTATVNIILRTHNDAWKIPTQALEFQPEERSRTEAAKAKLSTWQKREDADHWKPVWILDAKKQPWPIFVRIGGKNAAGEKAITDGRFNEVLEWDPEITPSLDAKNPATFPKLITGGPPGNEAGILNPPPLKLF
jgi:HlyD family secretion protein